MVEPEEIIVQGSQKPLAWGRIQEAIPSMEHLEGMIQKDVHGLAGRIQELLEQRCLLWDRSAVCLRAFAILSHRQLAEGRSRLGQSFINSVLCEAVDGLVFTRSMDASEARRQDEGFEIHGLPRAFAGAGVAAACRAHNRAPLEHRRAFRGLVIEGRSLDEVAKELGWDGGRTARAAREVLMAFLAKSATPETGSSDFPMESQSDRSSTGVPS